MIALYSCLATAAMGDFAGRSFEKQNQSYGFGRIVQRPDGNLWVGYEEYQDEHDVVNDFDVPRLFKAAILNNNGDHVAGSDQLLYTGNRFASGFTFSAMASQPDNKLLLSVETGQFLRFNPDGTRDPSFNPPASKNVYNAMAVQPDGKILVSPTLERFNPDGSKDPSFTSQLASDYHSELALQSSGKVLVDVGAAPYLKRLNTDGSIDSTFVAKLDRFVSSILVLPNDAILLRLFKLDSPYMTVRLNPDGSSDASFHPDPRLYVWYTVQPDGKTLASFRDPGTGQYFLGRMNVDGSLDSSYQTYTPEQSPGVLPSLAVFLQPDGSILAEITAPSEGQQFLRFNSSGVPDPASKTPFKIPAAVTKLAAQPDGKLLAGGDFNFVDDAETGVLIRLDQNGEVDGGFHPLMFAGTTTAQDLDLQNNGAILFSVSGVNPPAQTRLNPDGSVDSSFTSQNLGFKFKALSDDKIVTASDAVRRLLRDGNLDLAFSPTQAKFGGNQFDIPVGFAIQPDGKIVVAGNGESMAGIHSGPVNAGVVRLNSDGGIDSTFNPPTFTGGTRFNCVALQKDGKILLGGRFSLNDGSGIANLVRLNPDGSIDHTFVAVPDYTVSAILVERSGTILIGGGFSKVNGQPAASVARLQPNGQLDPSFTLDTRGGAVYALALLGDGRVVAGGEFGLAVSPALIPARLRNISSRMFVDGGDNALIAGIIIAGSGEKKLLGRAIGPSLAAAGIATPLQDPVLELRDSNGALLTSNDDWQQSSDKQAIIDTGIPPGDSRESALIARLPANGATYTAVVRPARGSGGIGLIELYDLDPPESSARLANISSRGNVLGGDKAMISGFIVDGSASMGPVKVIARGLGPTVPLSGSLQDPTLELHDNSAVISANDDWKQTQQFDIEATGIPPTDNRESAILRWVPPMPYTAILRGKNESTGIGLLEIYDLTN
jgi:uncharacterized delta-60 repeat protein